MIWLARDGNRTLALASGKADLRTGRAMAPGDAFRIGSLTKTFVATAVLQLVAAGRLRLDDSASRWLPALGLDRRITVRQLLGHTSGLYDYDEDPAFIRAVIADPRRVWRPEELIRRYATSHPPYFAPGNGWHYSNSGYLVLGLLIERVTGADAPAVIKRQILRPLQLRRTSFPTTPWIAGRNVHGYTMTASGWRDVTTYADPSVIWTAGAMTSTVADIDRFYRALLAGRVLPPAQLRAMQRFRTVEAGYTYGLGLERVDFGCAHGQGHTGGIWGFVTDVKVDDGNRRSFVVSINTESPPPAVFRPAGRAALLSLCGASPGGAGGEALAAGQLLRSGASAFR